MGRTLGEGKGYPLQCSGLKNSMDCRVHGVAKSCIRLSDFHFHLTCVNKVVPALDLPKLALAFPVSMHQLSLITFPRAPPESAIHLPTCLCPPTSSPFCSWQHQVTPASAQDHGWSARRLDSHQPAGAAMVFPEEGKPPP